MIWFWFVVGAVAFLGLGALFGAPYVPSRRVELRQLFKKGLPLGPHDVVVDMGSGDGIVLIEALRAGAARAVGYEIHPVFAAIGWLRTRRYGSRARVHWTNSWSADYPDDVTVVYAFGVEKDGGRLYQSVRRQATRVGRTLSLVSYGNPISGQTPRKTYRAYRIYSVKPE